MANTGVDRFLTCVIRRSEKDTIIRVGALILIMIVTPVVAILLTLDALWVYNNYIADPTEIIEFPNFVLSHLDDFAGAHMMEYSIGTYILYLVFRSYLNHCERDLEWMDSLIAYANHKGRNTENLTNIRNKGFIEKTRRVTKCFLIWFIIVLFVCGFQAVFISLKDMQPQLAVMTINILIFVMILQMAFTTIYIYRHIKYHTEVQHEFTTEFAKIMPEMAPKMETTECFIKDVALWKFLVPMILTFGLFSILSTMMSIHLMNHHIRDQWVYEEKLVRRIAHEEKAVGVEKVFSDREKTLAEKVLMVFSR
jgi:hypothetical protein